MTIPRLDHNSKSCKTKKTKLARERTPEGVDETSHYHRKFKEKEWKERLLNSHWLAQPAAQSEPEELILDGYGDAFLTILQLERQQYDDIDRDIRHLPAMLFCDILVNIDDLIDNGNEELLHTNIRTVNDVEIRIKRQKLAERNLCRNMKPSDLLPTKMLTYPCILDEISALVLDPGTAWTRAGFAGEDTPKAVIPSDYGIVLEEGKPFGGNLYIGDNAVHQVREGMEIRNPMKEGIVADWGVAPELWRHTIQHRLTSKTVEHPLMMTEPAWNPNKNREKTIEFAFEDFQVPAFYLAKGAVCAAFSSGKGTALVVDIGHGQASVTPVCDGLILKKGVMKSNLAGAHLNTQLRTQLTSAPYSLPLTPHFFIKSKTPYTDSTSPPTPSLRDFGFKPTDSYISMQQDRILLEFKETTSQVWTLPFPLPQSDDIQGADTMTVRSFEYPDGFSAAYKSARYLAPESLFTPGAQNAPNLGIATLIQNSLNQLDTDIRAIMLANIVVTGGTSLLYGFNDRLNMELNALFPGPKIKISAPGNTTERKYAGWLGGSVLASLGSFHQLWISKGEYEEVGAGIVEKRCK